MAHRDIDSREAREHFFDGELGLILDGLERNHRRQAEPAAE
ncbi:hypothetical protein [Nocardia acidivorans]|nr:hypothetical protein [Nocardia acidivorans]